MAENTDETNGLEETNKQEKQKQEEEEDIPTKGVSFGGDGAVGKTSAFLYYFLDKMKPDYVPTKVETNCGPKIHTYKKSGKKVRIYYDDHEGGGEDWHRLRHLGYGRTNVLVLCYSIGSRRSFDNIEEYWYPFAKKHTSKAPILLCGTQADVRTNQEYIDRLKKHNEKPITTAEGKRMAQKIKAVGYYECSAHEGKGVKELFEAAAEATILESSSNKKSGKCLIM